jgi:lipoteichoic acid synthase
MRESKKEKVRKVKSNYSYFKMYILFALSCIYLEVAFRILIYGSIQLEILLPTFSVLPIAGILTLICSFGTKRCNKVLGYIAISVLLLFYITNIVYYDIFKNFLSIYSLRIGTGQVLEFWKEILIAIKQNIPEIFTLSFIIPVFYILMNRFLNQDKKEEGVTLRFVWIKRGITYVTICFFHVIFLLILSISGKSLYSPYDLYYYTSAPEFSVKKLGLFTTVRVDVKRLIVGTQDKEYDQIASIISPGEENQNVDAENTIVDQKDSTRGEEQIEHADTSPNILEIDFETLIENEDDKAIKQIHEYISTVEPTNKNKYTGMFKGYNLILLTAEGFSPYAVDENVTPTLYKLTHEGFIFNNFYTPIWGVSTSDGEYVACTSLIPKAGVWSLFQSGSNSMPFVLGNQFNSLEITSRAYHNHSYTYYKRNISHPNMGYQFKAVGNGLEIKETWPESDLEMMEVTIPEFIDDESFHTYYMTVSGHMNYTFSGNNMADKNKEAVKDLPYSSDAKAYIACNVELDKALEKLITSLEEKGIADKTVIALSADHYPYGLEKDKIDELAGHKVEENFELYKNHFILWSAGMKENIVIDKPGSSLDILPTLSNLFGLEYDSRLLMGRDILSDAAPLIVFNNHSFITDKVMFNSITGKSTLLPQEEVTDEYLNSMNDIVNKKFVYSTKILDNNYYKYFLDNLDR